MARYRCPVEAQQTPSRPSQLSIDSNELADDKMPVADLIDVAGISELAVPRANRTKMYAIAPRLRAKPLKTSGITTSISFRASITVLPAAAFVLIRFLAMPSMHHHDSCPHTRQMLDMRENFVPNTLNSWPLSQVRATGAESGQPFYADISELV